MIQDFLAEFTIYKLIVSSVQSGILLLLGRGLMWLFRFHPNKEWAYWPIGFLFAFSTILTLNQIVNPPTREEFPQLAPLIESVTIADVPKRTDGSPVGMVTLVASVRNLGKASSTAEGFMLSVRTADGNTFIANRESIPEKFGLPFQGGQVMWISGEDALDRKTAIPIQRGAKQRGRLLYWFESLHAKELAAKDVVYTLTIMDNWGHETKMSRSFGEFTDSPQILDYPGMRTQSELRESGPVPAKPTKK